MRKLTLLTFLALTLAIPAQAARNKGQSYFSYDDGGTVVRQGDEGREIEARLNLPVYPGDEVVTSRRGRAEIRLADGNVIGIDRSTAVRFRSILDSYEGDASESIADLQYGKIAVYRTGDGRDYMRVDTPSGTYFASDEAIFSIETDSDGKDRVSVLEGTIEVRTPARNTRLRAGETAAVDDRGLYGLVSGERYDADDFERWFVRRAERYGGANSRYLDRSLAYYDDDLSRNGSWVHVSGFGWGWRPSVSVGWRPYYNGYWHRARSGCLTWVSYEPWGWVPYHYGRWSHDPYYGWFWLPGTGYAPAWVYWWHGSGYLGWAPAGWYDCYRPYYNWAYRPYAHHGINFGFGFYGRVRINEIDLRPWTFLDGNTIVSTRVDRAALSTDVIRGRLARESGGMATISGAPARLINERIADPTHSINRRWVGTQTGPETAGPIADVTPFFRRDPDISGTIRERIVRTRPSDGAAPSSRVGGGNVAPIGGGSVAPIGGGNLAPIGPSGGERVVPAPTPRDVGGRVRRGGESRQDVERTAPTSTPPTWRDRVARPERSPAKSEPAARPAPDAPISRSPETPRSDWRSRVERREPSADRGSRDVPRRVIDGIGGARVAPRDSGRDSGRREASPPPRSVDRPSRSEGGSSTRSAPPPQRESAGRSSSGSGSGGAKREGGGSSGGRIKRD
jgi:hypothetical protein